MVHDTPFVKRALNLGMKACLNFDGLSPEVIAYYEQHLGEIPAALARGFTVPKKFTLLADLGTITVPKSYVHSTALATFEKQNRKKCCYYNGSITDTNFKNPSRILKAGDKLSVCAYGHAVKGATTTSNERMEFLRAQNAVFVGAQGASLVFEKRRTQLPKGKWYASFDEPDRLWVDEYRSRRVPGVGAYEDGSFYFTLGDFEEPRRGDDAFLSFSDV